MKTTLLIMLAIFHLGSASGQDFYRGLERMCHTNAKGKIECYDAPRKWYHENTILIEKDSIFIYKVPLHIEKGVKRYSASDGAFYYYYGVVRKVDTSQIVYLTSYNCDYCGTRVRIDSKTDFSYPIPRIDTLKFTEVPDGIIMGKIAYKRLKKTKEISFPGKTMFYFDSNSISRQNPNGQYHLISQAIKNFLQTKELQLNKDTLMVCLDRYDNFDKRKLIEMLKPEFLIIDTVNINVIFLTRKELEGKCNKEGTITRYIEINEIIDYWKAARIALTYKILVPKSIHNFSGKEYFNLFEYHKLGNKYLLAGDLPENSWGLFEQK